MVNCGLELISGGHGPKSNTFSTIQRPKGASFWLYVKLVKLGGGTGIPRRRKSASVVSLTLPELKTRK
jgi:hypothetical protein